MKTPKRWTVESALRSWANLNDALRSCTEKFADKLLAHEKSGLSRPSFVLRIYKRKSALRRKRERAEL